MAIVPFKTYCVYFTWPPWHSAWWRGPPGGRRGRLSAAAAKLEVVATEVGRRRHTTLQKQNESGGCWLATWSMNYRVKRIHSANLFTV